ncbi:MAG: leucyl aminopeptidase [Thermoprotei archaeon]|nr:MAG: leucyl aminopeptidase [Thermoprotei archaeon]
MYEIKLFKGSPFDAKTETIAVIIKGKDMGKAWWIDEKLGNLFRNAVDYGDFSGNVGETILFYPSKLFKRYIVSSLGDEGLEGFRISVASVIDKVKNVSRDLVIYIPDDLGISLDDAVEQASLTIMLTLYDPSEKYKFKERKEYKLKRILINPSISKDHYEELIKRGITIGKAVNYARDIGNAPSSEMNPDNIEKEAMKLAREYGLKLRVYRGNELEKLGLNGILSVGKGGGHEPRLIILEYKGRDDDKWDLAIVGKTVTFDAGGLDLKTAQGMQDMKFDKCGGASVLGILKAVSELKLPVNIIGVLPVVENLPGPKAYKPRDIIKMYNGLTVEINSTDAEGRIILADALSFVEKNYNPKEIIDIATLTGAIVVALGNHAIGLFSTDDELANSLIETGDYTGERLWRMPLWKEYYDQLKSDIADLSNIGGRAGGAITAAAFLSKFVNNKKWAHLDIAGTAWVHEAGPKKPYYPKGATGIGVRLIVYYILKHLKK